MTRDAVRRRLARVVRAIGRWLLEHAVVTGARALAAYMRGRALVFQQRASSGTHPVWNRGRARRWRAVARWLDRVRPSDLAAACRDVAGELQTVPWVCEVAPS